jgi:poly(3-hydroxybutyrate) depolymerase
MKLAVIGLAVGMALGAGGILAACGNGDDDDDAGGDGGASNSSFDASVDHAATADAGAPADGGSADADAGPSDAGVDAADAGDPAHKTGQVLKVPGADGGTVARTYDITVPLDCATTTTKVPLVIALHGDTQQGVDLYDSFGLEQAARDAGAEAVFVYPNGTDDVGPTDNAWDLYDDPGTFPYAPVTPSGNEDVDYFDEMVATFQQLPCLGSAVFVTGLSSGGYMANQLARWRAKVVTGVAPMSGEAPTGNQGSDYPSTACPGITGSVPAFIIHGSADLVLTPDNGQQTASYWDIANKCTNAAADCADSVEDSGTPGLAVPPATPTTATMPSPCVTANGCSAAPVTFCLVPGLGHAVWPEAGSAVWSFIAATKPDAGT